MNRKVLLFGEYGVLNGGENSFLVIASRLVELGWKITGAVPKGTPFESELSKLGIPNVGFDLFDADRVRLSQDAIRNRCVDIIQKTDSTIVHCNSLSTSRLLGPVCHRMNVPSLGYLRDILKLSKTAIGDINCLDRIVAVSNATRDWHVAQGVDPSKTVVVYNAVDTNRFHPGIDVTDLNLELGLSDNDRVLLSVGQIGMRKGVESLLQAFEIIQRKIAGVHLLIVGQRNSQKPEAVEYEQRARAFATSISGNTGRVTWLGRREDVEVIMNRADLLLHAAKQEPLGRVLLEAAACGLPLIATDVGGTREILAKMKPCELMVAPDSPSELAARALELVCDAEKRKRISNRLLETIPAIFDINRCVSRLNDLYYQLCPDRT